METENRGDPGETLDCILQAASQNCLLGCGCVGDFCT